MGANINFPLIMTYKGTENPNFNQNGHKRVVYFSDPTFTENQIER